MVFATLAACAGGGDEGSKECPDGKHNWRKKQTVEQRRTCTTPEIRKRTCLDCGKEELIEGDPAAGHDFDETQKVYNHDATCTTDGTYMIQCTYQCTDADAIKSYPAPGTALGHSYITFTTTADGYSEVAQCVRCTNVTERLLGVKIDMNDRTHISYSTLKAVAPNSVAAPADSAFVTVGDEVYLRVNRPAGEYLGIAEYGVMITPRADILMTNDYVYETNVKLDKTATGDLHLIRGEKANLAQKLTFVAYKQGVDGNGWLETLDGPVYNLTDADYENGFTVAIVVNDYLRSYEVYVNNKLVTPVSVNYGDGDYFSGLQLASIGTYTVHGNTASTFDVASIYLYNAAEPNGFKGDTNVGYGIYNAENGERITYKLGDTSDDHEHAYNNIVKTVEPTCSTVGYTVKSCECGGEEISGETAPISHEWGNRVVINPTCTETGYEVDTCKHCGIKNGTAFGSPAGHTKGEVVDKLEPSCLEGGYTDYKCPKCGVVFREEHSKLGHALGEEVFVTEANCEKDGFTEGDCIRCGINYVDPNSIVKAFGHFAEKNTKVFKPNCTEGGYDVYTCELCGTEGLKRNFTNPIGHKYYSVEKKSGSRTILVTKCINCAFNEEIQVSTTKPDNSTMMSTIGNNLLGKLYNDDNTPEASAGDYTKEAPPYRFSQWESVTVDGDNFARIYSQSNAGVGGGNGHGYRDIVFSQTKTSVVFELDFKYPDTLQPNEANGMFELQMGGRQSGALKNFSCMKVDSSGNILIGGTKVGTITKDAWTKVAIVFDPVTRTYTGYVNGSKMVTCAMPAADAFPYDFFSEARMNNNQRNANKVTVIDVQNIYVYKADAPIYLAGLADYEDMSMIEDGVYSDVVLAGDASLNYKPDAQTKDYVYYFDKDSTVPYMGYKQHSALKIVERNGYKTLNFTTGDSVLSLDTLKKDGSPYLQGNADNYDSMLWIGGATATGSFNVSLDIRFNTVSGGGRLIEGRHGLKNISDGKGNGNARMEFVNFKNGKIYVNNGDGTFREVHTIVAGEPIKIDLFDRQADNMFDLYINNYLVAENVDYSDTTYGVDGAAKSGRAINDCQYLLFDMWSYKTFGDLDVDLDRVDVFAGKLAPDDFAGRLAGDAVLEDDDDYVLFNVNANTSITDFITPEKVGGLLYLKDGVLTKSTLAVTAGNARISKVGLGGGVDILDKYPGYYTLGFNDLTTNGKVDHGIYNVPTSAFAGLPLVPEVKYTADDKKEYTAKNVYDLSEFDTITLKYYVPENTPGYQAMFFIQNPNSYGFTYVSHGLPLTPGWHEEVWPLSSGWAASRGGSVTRAVSLFFRFFEWGNTGVDTNGDGKRNEQDAAPDGFGFYLNSITLNRTKTVVAEGTGFKTTELCYDHKYGEPVVGKAATPTEIGFSYVTCSVCGFKDVTAIPRVSHDELVKADPDNHVITYGANNKPASCEADGRLEYTCSCGYSVDEVLKKHNHKFVDGQDDDHKNVDASCTETGKEWYVCANENCELGGARYSIDTPALGHEVGADTTVIVIKPGTQDEPDTDYLCTDAKEKWAYGCAHGCVDADENPVKWKLEDVAGVAHTYVKNVTKDPDCVNVGYYDDICSVCGHTVEDIEIPALGHTIGDNTVLLEVAVGTGESKVEYKNCTDARELWAYGCCVEGCELGADAMWKVEDIEAGEHTYVKTDAIPASCTEAGVQYNVCSHCAYIERDEDAKLVVIDGVLQKPYLEYPTFVKGHTPSADVTYFEQSCVSASGRTYTCGDCGETVTEYDDNGPLGHDFGDWFDVTVADCGHDGFRDKDCSRCDVMYSETLDATQREIECVTGKATGEHGEYIKDVYSSDDEYVVRTKYDECSICGHKKNIVEVPAKYDENATEGFVFVKGADGKYYLVSYTGNKTEIVIPGTYSGATVVVAFTDAYTNIEKVTLLDGAILGDGAFKGWTALSEVVLPESVTKIPANAFNGCASLTEITLPAACTVIEANAFSGCAALTHVTVLGTLTEIQQFAFSGCVELYKVTYGAARPDDVIAILGNDALFEATWAK